MTSYNHAGISPFVWIVALTLATGSSRALDVISVPSLYACQPVVMAAASSWPHVHSRLRIRFGDDGNLFLDTKRHSGKSPIRPASLTLALSRGGASFPSDTPRASGVLSYYILWSPGVFKKTLYSLIALTVLRLATTPFRNQFTELVEKTASSPLNFILQLVILPLLSSACCGIQLVINALVGAGGCAGFNKYLGPLRPYFLALLFSATATTFPFRQSKAMVVNWAWYSILRWFVALMPELVHLWNVYAPGIIQRHADNDREADKLFTTIEMTIPSMGCVACINKIDSSVRRCAPDQIEEAKSWLEPSGKGGRTLVRAITSTEEEAERLAQSLVDAVRDAGFQTCSLDSIRIENESDLSSEPVV